MNSTNPMKYTAARMVQAVMLRYEALWRTFSWACTNSWFVQGYRWLAPNRIGINNKMVSQMVRDAASAVRLVTTPQAPPVEYWIRSHPKGPTVNPRTYI